MSRVDAPTEIYLTAMGCHNPRDESTEDRPDDVAGRAGSDSTGVDR